MGYDVSAIHISMLVPQSYMSITLHYFKSIDEYYNYIVNNRMAQTRNKRKNRSKKLNSTIICDKCKKICTRLQQHLNQNNSCQRHYNDIMDNNINANESSKRRSTRIKENTKNSVANLDIQIDEFNEKNDTQSSSIESNVFEDNDDTNLFEQNNNVLCKDTCNINHNTIVSQNDNSELPNIDLPTNDAIDVNCNNFHDNIINDNLPSQEHNHDYPENTNINSNEKFKPYDLLAIHDALKSARNTIAFSKKQLISLKLYEILHKSQAPISLYKEIQLFIDNSIQTLIGEEKPYIIGRTDLLNQMHSQIVFRGLVRKEKKIRRKKPTTNGGDHTNYDINGRNNNQSIEVIQTEEIIHVKPSNVLMSLEDKMFKHIRALFDLQFSMKPIETHIPLEGVEGKFPITTFCFVSSIIGLLQNPILMRKDNTLYHQPLYNDPSKEEYNQKNVYNDIHTSDWFKDTHAQIVDKNNRQLNESHINKDSSMNLLCPLIFFIDGVAIDSCGRRSLEPVSYTLGIFKRSVRNLPLAWRVLGYIPNAEKSYHGVRYDSTKNSSYLKKKHYQQMLHHILNQVAMLQNRGGFKWKLPFYKPCVDNNTGNDSFIIEYRHVNIIFEAMVVIGDTLGNDKLCCRKQTYVPTKLMNTGACRDCSVTYRNCDDYNYKCRFISRDFLKEVNPQVLNQLSFYDVGLLAFDSISFGSNKNKGINGSTPPEILHVWYLGIVGLMIEYFLARLTTKSKALLDKTVINMAQNYSRQSDRFMPKVSTFSSGIDKCKLTGKEKGYQLFMIYLIMNSSSFKREVMSLDMSSQKRYKIISTTREDGSKTKTKFMFHKVLDTSQKYNKWLRIFESMISIGEFFSDDNSINKSDLEKTIKVHLWTDEDNYVPHDDTLYEIDVPNEDNDEHTIPTMDGTNYSDRFEVNDQVSNNDNFLQSPDNVNAVNSNSSYCGSDNDEIDLSNDEVFDNITEENEFVEDVDDVDVMGTGVDTGTGNIYSIEISGRLKKQEFYISKVEYAIRVFMKQCKALLSVDDRVRLKTVKFHHLLHFPEYIRMFGSPANIDGSRPEAIGKETAKYPGRRTQYRAHTMNYQAGCRYYENTTIELSYCIACSTGQYNSNRLNSWNSQYFTKSYTQKLRDSVTKNVNNTTNSLVNENQGNMTDDQQVSVSGNRICIEYTYTKNTNIAHIGILRNKVHLSEVVVKKPRLTTSSSSSLFDSSLSMSALERSYYKQLVIYFINNKFLKKGCNAHGTIEFLSSLKVNNTIIRSCLSFYGHKQWFDWVDVTWEDEDQVLPAKIIAFVNGKKFLVDNGLLNGANTSQIYPSSEYWAIIQSSKQVLSSNVYVSKMSSHYNMENTLQCIPIHAISDTAFVVPDQLLLRHNDTISNRSTSFSMLEEGEFISFNSTNEWSKVFVECNIENSL